MSNNYTKSEYDNQYVVKPPIIQILEERHYNKGSDGSYIFAGHFA